MTDPLPTIWNPDQRIGDMLKGKRGLVVGIANADSIAFGAAAKLRAFGAGLAVTWLNDKAEPHVRPLAEQLGADITMKLDVEAPGEMEAVFERLTRDWGQLDFVIHSIAFAPRDDLHGRVIDCSADGFTQAMRVSCWSFLRMVKLAEPIMAPGGVLVTMSYYGADKVVANYNIMGPVKAALEASVRYAAAELGPRGVRIFAVSPGPLRTRMSWAYYFLWLRDEASVFQPVSGGPSPPAYFSPAGLDVSTWTLEMSGRPRDGLEIGGEGHLYHILNNDGLGVGIFLYSRLELGNPLNVLRFDARYFTQDRGLTRDNTPTGSYDALNFVLSYDRRY